MYLILPMKHYYHIGVLFFFIYSFNMTEQKGNRKGDIFNFDYSLLFSQVPVSKNKHRTDQI